MTRKRTTAIEWTEHTWNPFVGCTIQSPGCVRCYAMRQALRMVRMGTTPVYDGTVRVVNGRAVWTGKINRGSDATWRAPRKIRTPSLVFVNSMSDFWHPNARDEWKLEALRVMAETPHQYQVLTKVPEQIGPFLERTGVRIPPNVWLGVTVERSDFMFRAELLEQIDARVRFISAEPLLDELEGIERVLERGRIHQVIVGGESDQEAPSRARPMHIDWPRRIREACELHHVAFFFKQWGNWIHEHEPASWQRIAVDEDTIAHTWPDGTQSFCVRYKRQAGGELDGRDWKELPSFEIPLELESA
jgi:protein gp37